MEDILKRQFTLLGVILLVLSIAVQGRAHFGMVIPSDSMVMQDENKTIHLALSFSHPFEMQGMPLVKPSYFDVDINGKKTNLVKQLKQTQIMNHKAWEMNYTINRPGVYTFVMKPQPYWEPAENCFIVHLTKTVVTAFGDDEGWDREIGLKTEIVPLTKPFGLYAGNLFQGIVKLDGKPVPFAEVEVEYYNKNKRFRAPTEYMITQTIKADQNGVFSYVAPKPGWWGFAALNEADYTINKNGEEKSVEIGAVIWVEVVAFQVTGQ